MKNMRISKKLMLSFAIMAILALIVGIVGLIGMAHLNTTVANLQENAGNSTIYTGLVAIIVITNVISVAAAITLAIYLSRSISKPLITMAEFMHIAAESGEIHFHTKDELELVEKFAGRDDEIGKLVSYTVEFTDEIQHEMDVLTQIANGDLTITPNILSDKDVVGHALTKVVDSLNGVFGEIHLASKQVSSGSHQIADGAQTLAQGSTEQAASVEELSASVNEIKSMIGQSDKDTDDALDNSNTSVKLMDKSRTSMKDMMNAMNAMSESAQSIAKIIRVIDDIAFQTNILALNAAVEAARAGQHGKGFAVVADEVRNLAAKSAEAAKETAAIIAGDADNVKEGLRAATQVNENLGAVDKSIAMNTDLLSHIAETVRKQASEINAINDSMEKISDVTQSNAATAEESAASAEELSGQSAMLEGLASRFKLKKSHSGLGNSNSSAKSAASRFSSGSTSFALDNGTGKY